MPQSYDKPRQCIKKQRRYFACKGPYIKAMIIPVVVYGCDSWTIKKAECQRTDALNCVLEKTLESPLDCEEIQPVNPKGNQPWIFIGRTNAEAEAPILWPPEAKNWLIWKDPDAGKDWRWEVKGMTEDVMVGWHHQLDGHEFEEALGVGDRQGSLACCSPESCKCQTQLSDWTELNHWITEAQNWNEISLDIWSNFLVLKLIWLSDFTFTFYFHALEKETATHSSVLAWRIPGTGSLVGCHLWGRIESDMTEVT